jgi:hypothetical protein
MTMSNDQKHPQYKRHKIAGNFRKLLDIYFTGAGASFFFTIIGGRTEKL